MKKLMLLAAMTLAAIIAAPTFAQDDSTQPAKEKKEHKTVTVKGVVAVTGEGDAQQITIKPAEGEAVAVINDEKAKEVVALNGKTVEATGFMTKKGLKVKTVAEAGAAAPAPGAAK